MCTEGVREPLEERATMEVPNLQSVPFPPIRAVREIGERALLERTNKIRLFITLKMESVIEMIC